MLDRAGGTADDQANTQWDSGRTDPGHAHDRVVAGRIDQSRLPGSATSQASPFLILMISPISNINVKRKRNGDLRCPMTTFRTCLEHLDNHRTPAR